MWSPTSGTHYSDLRQNSEWTRALGGITTMMIPLHWIKSVMPFTRAEAYVLGGLILLWYIHIHITLHNEHAILYRISSAHIPQERRGAFPVVMHSRYKGHP